MGKDWLTWYKQRKSAYSTASERARRPVQVIGFLLFLPCPSFSEAQGTISFGISRTSFNILLEGAMCSCRLLSFTVYSEHVWSLPRCSVVLAEDIWTEAVATALLIHLSRTASRQRRHFQRMGWKGPKAPPSPTPAVGWLPPAQLPRAHPRPRAPPGMGQPQLWALFALWVKSFLLTSDLNLPSFSLNPLPLVLSLSACVKSWYSCL